MANGYKTGGRKAGVPNKKTRAIQERLEELGCDPLEGMAKIAMDESIEVNIRLTAYKELAQYLYPKRKAIEVVEEREDEKPESIQIYVHTPESYAEEKAGRKVKRVTEVYPR